MGRALPSRLGNSVWFYVAAVAALVAGMGLGLWLAGGVADSADAYRAMRLAHVHLNVLGWVGLAVVGTQFTLWPTVLRTPHDAWAGPSGPLVAAAAGCWPGRGGRRSAHPASGGGAGRAGRLHRRAGARRGPVRPHGAAAATAHGGVLDAGGRHGLVHGRGRRVRVADPDRGAHLPAAGGVRPRGLGEPPADGDPRAGLAPARGRRQPRGAGAAPGPSGRVGDGDGLVADRPRAGQLRQIGRGGAGGRDPPVM